MLTDEKGNVTTWAYDVLNRVQSETIEIDSTPYSREYEYDDNGNVIRKTDRDGRVTEYEYDDRTRMREEDWLDEYDAVINTISYDYDAAGELTHAEDDISDSEYG